MPSEQRSTNRFPWKLHQVLSDAEEQGKESIISWLPDGKSFRVHNREKFVSGIMKTYFNQTKFKSFQRQLNLWGFQTSTKGDGMEKGAYFHESFVKGKPELCHGMNRQKVKGAVPPIITSSSGSAPNRNGTLEIANSTKAPMFENGSCLSNNQLQLLSQSRGRLFESAINSRLCGGYPKPLVDIPHGLSSSGSSNTINFLRTVRRESLPFVTQQAQQAQQAQATDLYIHSLTQRIQADAQAVLLEEAAASSAASILARRRIQNELINRALLTATSPLL